MLWSGTGPVDIGEFYHNFQNWEFGKKLSGHGGVLSRFVFFQQTRFQFFYELFFGEICKKKTKRAKKGQEILGGRNSPIVLASTRRKEVADFHLIIYSIYSRYRSFSADR